MDAATNGTLSIAADKKPRTKTTISNPPKITQSTFSKVETIHWPTPKTIPKASSAPTAIKIPKKNKILGISIFVSA